MIQFDEHIFRKWVGYETTKQFCLYRWKLQRKKGFQFHVPPLKTTPLRKSTGRKKRDHLEKKIYLPTIDFQGICKFSGENLIKHLCS